MDFVYLILLAVLLIIFVTNRLQNSRIGRAWEAMREDETVARAMGINILTTKLMAFAIGAAFAGLGGVLFAARNQFTGPEDHNLMVSINVLSLLIVGGMGSIPGVIAGAFALKGLPESPARAGELPRAGLRRPAGGHDDHSAGGLDPILAAQTGCPC